MNTITAIPDAYCNLGKIIDYLKDQKVAAELIDSLYVARRILVAVELMGTIQHTNNDEIN